MVCQNTITDIIEELSRIQIEDSKIAWQLRNLTERFLILEGIYGDLSCSHSGLTETEQKRYTEEVFPAMLKQCHKLADYFTMCPMLRNNKQDVEILGNHFKSYANIVDRLLIKLQKSIVPSRISVFAKVRTWFKELSKNIDELHELIYERFSGLRRHFYFPHWLARTTFVRYHRDSIDYVGSGYSLQPIQALSLEYA